MSALEGLPLPAVAAGSAAAFSLAGFAAAAVPEPPLVCPTAVPKIKQKNTTPRRNACPDRFALFHDPNDIKMCLATEAPKKAVYA